MPKNFIFDLDGTLVDSLPGIEYAIDAALARSHCGPRMLNLRTVIGPPIRSILQTLSGADSQCELDKLELSFRSSYDTGGWRKTVCYLGARDVLRSLFAQGKQLFLLTNKPSDSTQNILHMLALRNYFKDVLTPDSSEPAFPDKPEMLRYLMGRHGIGPEESIMVGDTAEDYLAAAEVGMPAAIMAHGYGAAALVTEFPDCRLVKEFSEITSDCLYKRRTA
jgi:phosphoglycolate phosphatase